MSMNIVQHNAFDAQVGCPVDSDAPVIGIRNRTVAQNVPSAIFTQVPMDGITAFLTGLSHFVELHSIHNDGARVFP